MQNWFDSDYIGNRPTAKPSKKFGKRAIVLIAVAAVLGLGLMAANIYMSVLQLKEVSAGYTQIYWTNLCVKAIVWVASFVITFLLVFANNLVIRTVMKKDNYDLKLFQRITPVFWISIAVSFFTGNLIGITAYDNVLKFLNAVPFNISDPIFGYDIGYYVFKRPLYMTVTEGLKGLLFFMIIYTAVVYVILILRDGVGSFKEIFKKKRVIFHVFADVILYFTAIALTYKFTKEQLLFGKFGNLTGAGYTDINIMLNFYKAAPFLLMAIVIITIILMFKGKLKSAAVSVVAFPVILIVVNIVAAVAQNAYVIPNEVVLETPYIQHHINFTRFAYGIDNVQSFEYEIKNDLTVKDIEDNRDIINDIRIADFKANLTSVSKLQELGTYFSFKDSDVIPYTIDGQKRSVFISARELDKNKLAEKTDTYINKTLSYTHGYGVVMSSVSEVTPEGQPKFYVSGMPVQTSGGVPEISQPRIYYGEMTNDHAVVNTKIKETDYVKGAQSYEFNYDGSGGLPMTFMNKLLFGIRYSDINLILSGQITSQSRILPNRNVVERAKMVAPFFRYDSDPYIVLTDNGELKWVLDAYTTSDDFPYSARMKDGTNYIRNSVKAVIDAYNGDVTFYLTDKTDAIAMTYAKIYPNLFAKEDMPEAIASHVIYPEELFQIQAELYKKYHVSEPNVFYGQTDLWTFSKQRYETAETQDLEPYYNMANVPQFSKDGASFVLMMPYTQTNNDYINAWFAVGSEKDNYGKMVVYKFNETGEKKAYGTMQIENRIDNDPKITSQIALWNQGGTSALRGNIIVVPIKNTLLYVEPLYITTKNTASFPELKRVIVAYGDKIAMENTLDDCLSVIFGKKSASQPVNDAPSVIVDETPDDSSVAGENADIDITEQIILKYNEYKKYNSENDYINAGKAMNELDVLMNRMEDKVKEAAE